MEEGAKALAKIILASLVLGALVVALHPQYRETARAIWRSQVESSPIWISNGAYYSGIDASGGANDHQE